MRNVGGSVTQLMSSDNQLWQQVRNMPTFPPSPRISYASGRGYPNFSMTKNMELWKSWSSHLQIAEQLTSGVRIHNEEVAKYDGLL